MAEVQNQSRESGDLERPGIFNGQVPDRCSMLYHSGDLTGNFIKLIYRSDLLSLISTRHRSDLEHDAHSTECDRYTTRSFDMQPDRLFPAVDLISYFQWDGHTIREICQSDARQLLLNKNRTGCSSHTS